MDFSDFVFCLVDTTRKSVQVANNDSQASMLKTWRRGAPHVAVLVPVGGSFQFRMQGMTLFLESKAPIWVGTFFQGQGESVVADNCVLDMEHSSLRGTLGDADQSLGAALVLEEFVTTCKPRYSLKDRLYVLLWDLERSSRVWTHLEFCIRALDPAAARYQLEVEITLPVELPLDQRRVRLSIANAVAPPEPGIRVLWDVKTPNITLGLDSLPPVILPLEEGWSLELFGRVGNVRGVQAVPEPDLARLAAEVYQQGTAIKTERYFVRFIPRAEFDREFEQVEHESQEDGRETYVYRHRGRLYTAIALLRPEDKRRAILEAADRAYLQDHHPDLLPSLGILPLLGIYAVVGSTGAMLLLKIYETEQLLCPLPACVEGDQTDTGLHHLLTAACDAYRTLCDMEHAGLVVRRIAPGDLFEVSEPCGPRLTDHQVRGQVTRLHEACQAPGSGRPAGKVSARLDRFKRMDCPDGLEYSSGQGAALVRWILTSARGLLELLQHEEGRPALTYASTLLEDGVLKLTNLPYSYAYFQLMVLKLGCMDAKFLEATKRLTREEVSSGHRVPLAEGTTLRIQKRGDQVLLLPRNRLAAAQMLMFATLTLVLAKNHTRHELLDLVQRLSLYLVSPAQPGQKPFDGCATAFAAPPWLQVAEQASTAVATMATGASTATAASKTRTGKFSIFMLKKRGRGGEPVSSSSSSSPSSSSPSSSPSTLPSQPPRPTAVAPPVVSTADVRRAHLDAILKSRPPTPSLTAKPASTATATAAAPLIPVSSTSTKARVSNTPARNEVERQREAKAWKRAWDLVIGNTEGDLPFQDGLPHKKPLTEYDGSPEKLENVWMTEHPRWDQFQDRYNAAKSTIPSSPDLQYMNRIPYRLFMAYLYYLRELRSPGSRLFQDVNQLKDKTREDVASKGHEKITSTDYTYADLRKAMNRAEAHLLTPADKRTVQIPSSIPINGRSVAEDNQQLQQHVDTDEKLVFLHGAFKDEIPDLEGYRTSVQNLRKEQDLWEATLYFLKNPSPSPSPIAPQGLPRPVAIRGSTPQNDVALHVALEALRDPNKAASLMARFPAPAPTGIETSKEIMPFLAVEEQNPLYAVFREKLNTARSDVRFDTLQPRHKLLLWVVWNTFRLNHPYFQDPAVLDQALTVALDAVKHNRGPGLGVSSTLPPQAPTAANDQAQMDTVFANLGDLKEAYRVFEKAFNERENNLTGKYLLRDRLRMFEIWLEFLRFKQNEAAFPPKFAVPSVPAPAAPPTQSVSKPLAPSSSSSSTKPLPSVPTPPPPAVAAPPSSSKPFPPVVSVPTPPPPAAVPSSSVVPATKPLPTHTAFPAPPGSGNADIHSSLFTRIFMPRIAHLNTTEDEPPANGDEAFALYPEWRRDVISSLGSWIEQGPYVDRLRAHLKETHPHIQFGPDDDRWVVPAVLWFAELGRKESVLLPPEVLRLLNNRTLDESSRLLTIRMRDLRMRKAEEKERRDQALRAEQETLRHLATENQNLQNQIQATESRMNAIIRELRTLNGKEGDKSQLEQLNRQYQQAVAERQAFNHAFQLVQASLAERMGILQQESQRAEQEVREKQQQLRQLEVQEKQQTGALAELQRRALAESEQHRAGLLQAVEQTRDILHQQATFAQQHQQEVGAMYQAWQEGLAQVSRAWQETSGQLQQLQQQIHTLAAKPAHTQELAILRSQVELLLEAEARKEAEKRHKRSLASEQAARQDEEERQLERRRQVRQNLEREEALERKREEEREQERRKREEEQTLRLLLTEQTKPRPTQGAHAFVPAGVFDGRDPTAEANLVALVVIPLLELSQLLLDAFGFQLGEIPLDCCLWEANRKKLHVLMLPGLCYVPKALTQYSLDTLVTLVPHQTARPDIFYILKLASSMYTLGPGQAHHLLEHSLVVSPLLRDLWLFVRDGDTSSKMVLAKIRGSMSLPS